jgi:hypothetical protein
MYADESSSICTSQIRRDDVVYVYHCHHQRRERRAAAAKQLLQVEYKGHMIAINI